MKKAISVMLAAGMAVSLAACGGSSSSSSSASGSAAASAQLQQGITEKFMK